MHILANAVISKQTHLFVQNLPQRKYLPLAKASWKLDFYTQSIHMQVMFSLKQTTIQSDMYGVWCEHP